MTLERLISLGYSDTQAREMIGAVLIGNVSCTEV